MLEFIDAKNGEKTVSYNGKFLHSKYNPSNEGEKFAASVQADFSPLCVILIEPALAYSFSSLKKRFPKAKFVSIRFFKEFTEQKYLKDFSGTFFFDENINLSEELFNFLTEEEICSSLVLEWNPSKLIFPEENAKVWIEIKKAILKARDVLGTRSYFSKRWFKNSVTFFNSVKNTCTVKKMNAPVIVAASGTSLKSSIDFLKKYRQNYFLIAVSSAFLPLLSNEIIPDIVMSTDGGYWAKKHLDFSFKNKDFSKIKFAFSSESNVPKKLLENENIIPLCYDDDEIQKEFFASLGMDFMYGRRNGTVSGTAVEFAVAISSGNVYCVGLDQAPAKGFQHTQPNALETGAEISDFRMKPKETRLAFSQFSSQGSLELYRNWFIEKSKTRLKRVSRLSDNFNFEFKLGSIKDINWKEFERIESKKEIPSSFFSEPKTLEIPKSERKKEIQKIIRKISGTEIFRKEFFPMETLLIMRELDDKKKLELQKSLELKVSEFIEDLL